MHMPYRIQFFIICLLLMSPVISRGGWLDIINENHQDSPTKGQAATNSEWEPIGNSDNSSWYISMPSIQPTQAGKKAWILQNHNKAEIVNGKPSFSNKFLDEHDCKSKTRRPLYFLDYSDPMGKGTAITATEGSGKWVPVIPDSVSEMIHFVLCVMNKQ